MNGPSHMATSAAAYLLFAPAILHQAGHDLEPRQILAGTVVAAGAGLLPDIDQPTSNLARVLGPISYAISKTVNKLAGGHRRGTHSLLAVIGVAYATAWVVDNMGLWSVLALTLLPLSMVTRVALGQRKIITNVLAAATLTLLLWALTPGTEWLVPAIAIGYALHLVGDMLTVQGVPLLWPLHRPIMLLAKVLHFNRIPILGRALMRFIHFLCEAAGLGLFRTDSVWETGVRKLAVCVLFVGLITQSLWPMAVDNHPDLFGSMKDNPPPDQLKARPVESLSPDTSEDNSSRQQFYP